MEKLNLIAKQLAELSVSEAKELLKILEEEYGIKAPETTIPILIVKEVEEKVAVQTEFSIFLESAGLEKLKVIKVVKDLTKLPLIEAKNLVDSVPVLLFKDISESKAKEYVAQLSNMGASVTIK